MNRMEGGIAGKELDDTLPVRYTRPWRFLSGLDKLLSLYELPRFSSARLVVLLIREKFLFSRAVRRPPAPGFTLILICPSIVHFYYTHILAGLPSFCSRRPCRPSLSPSFFPVLFFRFEFFLKRVSTIRLDFRRKEELTRVESFRIQCRRKFHGTVCLYYYGTGNKEILLTSGKELNRLKSLNLPPRERSHNTLIIFQNHCSSLCFTPRRRSMSRSEERFD